MKVVIIGAGKVGTALSTALTASGAVEAELCSYRGRGIDRWPDADLSIVATRDGDIGNCAAMLARCPGTPIPVVHCAGSLGPEALAPLAHVAQMHPLLSFASIDHPPSFAGAFMRVCGDQRAVDLATRVAEALQMRPGALEGVDPAMYHAAAALCANGAAALIGEASRLVGVPSAPAILGPLLRSVAENATALGLPQALTGPVRRGDATAVRAHLERLRAHAPDMLPLYLALISGQLTMARQLAEAPLEKFDEIADVTSKA